MVATKAAGPALDLSAIRLFLFDIDGVFLTGKEAPRLVSGLRAIAAIRQLGLPFRLLTNSSTDTSEEVAAALVALGIDVEPRNVHCALDVAVQSAAARFPGGRCHVFGERGLHKAAEAAGLLLVDEPPADVVLVGLHRGGDYRQLSRAARCLRAGAALFGCHRNRMWVDEDGPCVSCGPWLAALEHATGVAAVTFGKPSASFYEWARAPLGVAARETMMVGDDLEADVLGAERCGMRTALVLTGKTDRAALAASPARPDLVLDEVDDLAALLTAMGAAPP